LRILVALEGNAILAWESKGTAEEQFDRVRGACKHLVGIIQQVSYFAFSMARRDLTAIMTAVGAVNATI
jgi:carbamate kinase